MTSAGAGGPGPTRFCPTCYERNAWSATRCAACGSDLQSDDDFDARLIWALRHPDTATAVRATQALAVRRVTGAIGALTETVRSPEAYRAAAAAAALATFRDDPAAGPGIEAARRHASVLVRRAVERGERPEPG